MSFQILDANGWPTRSFVSKASYVIAGAIAGRKAYQVAACSTCKVVSLMARVFRGKESAANWNKSSKEYCTAAKHGFVRDLMLAAGFLALGLGLEKTGISIPQSTPQQPNPSTKPPVVYKPVEFKTEIKNTGLTAEQLELEATVRKIALYVYGAMFVSFFVLTALLSKDIDPQRLKHVTDQKMIKKWIPDLAL